LAKGIGINEDFDVRGLHNEKRGKMTVKISITDPSKSTKAKTAEARKDISAA
jgi:hypothetical protein